MPSSADISVIVELKETGPLPVGGELVTDIHTFLVCWEDVLSTLAASPPIVAPWKTAPDAYRMESVTAN